MLYLAILSDLKNPKIHPVLFLFCLKVMIFCFMSSKISTLAHFLSKTISDFAFLFNLEWPNFYFPPT